MTRQLSAILDYVDQLQQVNTDGVEPLAHPLPIHNVFRDDEPAPSLPVDEALANAPDRQRRLLRRAGRARLSAAPPSTRRHDRTHRRRTARPARPRRSHRRGARPRAFLARHPRARPDGPGVPARR